MSLPSDHPLAQRLAELREALRVAHEVEGARAQDLRDVARLMRECGLRDDDAMRHVRQAEQARSTLGRLAWHVDRLGDEVRRVLQPAAAP